MCDSSTSLKFCRGCGERKPSTREFFDSDKSKADGLGTRCKTCRRVSRIRRSREGSLKSQVPEGQKLCMKCKQLFAATLENFSPSKKGRGGLFSWCKPCAKLNMRQRRPSPKPLPAVIPGKKRCSRCGEHKDANRKNFGPGARMTLGLHSWCKECMREAGRQFRQENPEKVAVDNQKRRARILDAPGKHTIADIKNKLRQQNEVCYWCKEPLILSGEGKYHIDHLIPLSRGGSNGPENIVCSCPSCNLSKNNRLPHEWIARLL